MNYIPHEIVNKAQQVDLLTYLKSNEPEELIHISGDNYCTRTHDSLKISNGLWNWFSKGIGGKNAIDYLIIVKGHTFLEAVEKVIGNNKMLVASSVIENVKKTPKSSVIIPEKSYNCDIVKEYLINRGIDENIIEYCIQKHLIYQEKETNNVVFIGYDNCNNIMYAGIRATNDTRYMRDATGSNKTYSFRLLSNTNNETLHVFESAIDLLSYATLLKLKGLDYRNENLISLSGVYQPSKVIEQSKVPVAIKEYLQANSNIKNIALHFDNDNAGRNATKALKIVIPKQYNVVDMPVPIGKDVNDYLCYKLGLKRFKRDYKR